MIISTPWIVNGRKSAANMTAVVVKGQQVLKGKSLGPTGIPTPRQVAQRVAMRTMVAIARATMTGIDVGFKQHITKQSPFNQFISIAISSTGGCIDYSAPPLAAFVPADMTAAKGTIAPTVLLTAVADVSAQSITTTWNPLVIGAGQGIGDREFIVLYNETTDTWLATTTSQQRQDGANTQNVGMTGWSFIITDTIRVWMFFEGIGDDGVTPNGTVSDSVTIAASVVA